jgi:hypothetical protein
MVDDRAIQGLTQRRRLVVEVGRRKEIGASRRRSRPSLSDPSQRRCQIGSSNESNAEAAPFDYNPGPA